MMYKGQGISAAIVIGFGLFGIMLKSTTGMNIIAALYMIVGILTAWLCSVIIHASPKQWGLLDFWLKRW
jgi:uncharacterized membrane protein YdcZ (DUF606 family)